MSDERPLPAYRAHVDQHVLFFLRQERRLERIELTTSFVRELMDCNLPNVEPLTRSELREIVEHIYGVSGLDFDELHYLLGSREETT